MSSPGKRTWKRLSSDGQPPVDALVEVEAPPRGRPLGLLAMTMPSTDQPLDNGELVEGRGP